ncbi:MAG: hypothetical protein AAGH79_13950 [Bacteroidota bacterium]
MNLRTLLLTGCFLFGTLLNYGQNQLLQDLRDLSTLLEDENPVATVESLTEMASILRRYDTNLANETSVSTILAAYESNTYLAPFIDFSIVKDNRLEGILVGSATGATALVASGIESTGLTLSRSADGLARFYVQRVKEELNRSFFDRFERHLEKDSLLGFWFPATKSTMMAVGEEIYRFEWYVQDLRVKFFTDLSKLDVRTVQYLRDRGVFDNDLYESLAEDVVVVADLFQNGGSPIAALNYLGESAVLQTLGTGSLAMEIANLQSLFQLVNRLSETLQIVNLNEEEDVYWISKDELLEALGLRYGDFLFMGLIYQRMQDLNYLVNQAETIPFLSLEQMPKVLAYTKDFLSLGELAIEALRDFKEEQTSESDSLAYLNYYQFIHPSLQIIESIDGLLQSLHPENAAQEILQNYVGAISDLNELVLAIDQSRFLQGVAYLSSLLDRLQVQIPNQTLQRVVLYGQFMAAIIDVDNSEEAAEVIESFALPPGSASIKKETPFNVAINGFTGLSGGLETLTSGPDTSQDPATFYALSAPLGITISAGLGEVGSISLYGTILDIGALTAFRFADDSTKDLPEFTFQNIYTPGLYLVYGIPRVPLSVGFGYQNGPNLRGVVVDPASGDLTFEMAEGYRWNAFIGVDIPLLNLVRTTEKK